MFGELMEAKFKDHFGVVSAKLKNVCLSLVVDLRCRRIRHAIRYKRQLLRNLQSQSLINSTKTSTNVTLHFETVDPSLTTQFVAVLGTV